MNDHILEKSAGADKLAGDRLDIKAEEMKEATADSLSLNDVKIRVQNLSFYYGAHKALENISMSVKAKKVTALIGPSGCGKSTFLRLFNRMNDLIPLSRIEGKILVDGKDVYGKE